MLTMKKKNIDEETSYWLSYSDMMAALLLTFVLIISFTVLQAKKQYELKEAEMQQQKEKMEQQQELLESQQGVLKKQEAKLQEQQKTMEDQQEQLDKIIGVRSDLVQALKSEFSDSQLSVYVDAQTGAITFDSSILFDYNSDTLKSTGEEFLREFIPKYINVLMSGEFREYVSEIIIEGHTDTYGGYIYNLDLSQRRAFSVAKFCLSEDEQILPKESIEELRKIVTSNGRSYSEPVYNDDGTVNMDASRRVEFMFRLKDDEMVREMSEILSSN